MQCMDRDWMTTGRRPSGLCGAAIIIASRIHGFKRSTKQITDVVHVCDDTIKKRLDEFSRTGTAKMTPDDLDLSEKTREAKFYNDPPAFSRNRLKEKELEKIKKHADNIQKCLKETISVPDSHKSNTSTKDGEYFLPIIVNQVNQEINKQEDILVYNKEEIKDSEELSDIDENEVQKFIVSNDEYKLKKLLWEILFKDWIDEQKEKRKVEKKQVKRKIRKLSRLDTTVSRDPVEAIKNSSRFGKKINFNLLKRMFVKK